MFRAPFCFAFFAFSAIRSGAVDTPLTRQLQTLLTGQAGTSFAAAEVLKTTRYAGYVLEQETPRFLMALKDDRAYVVDAAARCLENNRSWKTPVLRDALVELLTAESPLDPPPNRALCIKPVFIRLEDADRLEFTHKYLASDDPAVLLALIPLAKEAHFHFTEPHNFDRLLDLLAHPDGAVAMASLETLVELVTESNHEEIARVVRHLENGSEPLLAEANHLISRIAPHTETDRQAIRQGLLETMRAVGPQSKTGLLAKALRRKFLQAPLKPKPKSTSSARINCPGVVLRSTREMRGRGKAIRDD